MRLRKKWWARPELEENKLFVNEPRELKGKWKEEFGNNNPIHLELGCGRGGFLTQNCLKYPDINHVAIDLKDEVLVYAMRKVQEYPEINNGRLVALNISFVSELFDKDEIEKIYINFCNPWPKDRHNKRRLTHSRFLEEYKKFLKVGSEMWFKTDDTNLFNDSQEYFKESGFEIEFLTYDLHNSDFKENIMTEYETKFTKLGMKTMFLKARLK
ncbi:tRNA (guanosine(46)-N7)-methyltransferase TrmB [Clostridium sp. SHJSY1]|uniref:tRNA (guanosine(46)-N7)-methyltransferase TrmB n=1 Tax=Clostridium sp. SHJSY1 TaxID=2942483 RepID=UPI002874AD56|nr:tRNA (guanosine(46)-N7)-methyltransferase TrmB [Clostridium sp. SHJSY1]MDS0524741.1 tRNA (guanosine(46)-N7)-methyltransferase TrmB [Clostridium sp. SHJSY1]